MTSKIPSPSKFHLEKNEKHADPICTLLYLTTTTIQLFITSPRYFLNEPRLSSKQHSQRPLLAELLKSLARPGENRTHIDIRYAVIYEVGNDCHIRSYSNTYIHTHTNRFNRAVLSNQFPLSISTCAYQEGEDNFVWFGICGITTRIIARTNAIILDRDLRDFRQRV